MTPDAFVVAVVATYRRPDELRRCLEALARESGVLKAVMVTDNGNDERTAEIVAAFGALAERIVPAGNLGAGGGLTVAMRTASERFGPVITHYLILDDDTELSAGALGSLVEAMAEARADVACPLIEDGEGKLGWFPRLVDPEAWGVIKSVGTAGAYRAACGDTFRAFTWSTFVCLLVSARAVHTVGWPRTDFWVRGEDLEYSLRLTAQHRSALVPSVCIRHLPPSRSADSREDPWKALAMLQNSAYLGSRVPHARALLRHLPGNVVRFLQAFAPWRRSGISAIRALYRGLIRGKPAGADRFDQFRQRAAKGPRNSADRGL